MSPEQAQGKKVDARSDIFSFGAVLYEMVTGQRAFQGDSSMSTLAAILSKEPKPVSEIAPATPHDLAKIISRCLRKDPEKRFQHMADLKVALAELKEESESGKLAAQPVVAVTNHRRLLWISAAAVLVVAAVASTWFLRTKAPPPEVAMTSAPLTTYAGSESMPTFSPDGNQVAFVWNGNAQDNFDIYVKLIRTEPPLRLTTDPAGDASPAWSPDGRSIAFLRATGDGAEVLLIPALGGPERKVAEVLRRPQRPSIPPLLAWLPHGDGLVFADASSADESTGLFLFSMKTGERRRLTSPPKASVGDSGVAISPDGEKLVFVRTFSFQNSHLYLLALSSDLRPVGEPERIATNLQACYNPAWTSDGKDIVFSAVEQGNERLWRIPASGSAVARPLAAGEGGDDPAISRQGNRLAYRVGATDSNLWKVAISGQGTNHPVKVISSSRQDVNAQYSPDGKRIVFASDRSGDMEIWASNADGSAPAQLTSLGAHSGTPRWAPDGRRIAFDSNKEGRFQIYSIDAGGGVPQRLTRSPVDDAAPSWSRDGKQIYFSSKRTGRWEVWKMPAEGGDPVQVTRQGGFSPFESPDRQLVYCQKTEGNSEVWKVPVDGGQESKVLDPVGGRQFAVADQGIYFIRYRAATPTLQVFRFATGETKEITRIGTPTMMGLSVSPDGRSLLYTQIDQVGSDLMLVENFR
ncbi:MAG TPA: protein kinase [Bryobacteraceae bacterium]|nr:protein kinase [Bryobacteraceae bacterium]